MHDIEIYRKFNQILKAKRNLKFRLKNNSSERFLKIFDYCLTLLDEEYQTILKKSYIENDYEFWWVDYYCKSSYYRKRFSAVLAFVQLFEKNYEDINDYSFNFSSAN